MTGSAARRTWRARVQPWIEALVLVTGWAPALPEDQSQPAGICACPICVRELVREIQRAPHLR